MKRGFEGGFGVERREGTVDEGVDEAIAEPEDSTQWSIIGGNDASTGSDVTIP